MSTVHVSPLSTYITIFSALMILTALTVGIAFLDLGSFNPVVALGVACIKATLVILYFMHVRYGPRLVWVLAGSGFAWLAIFVAFTIADYVTRGPIL